MLRISSPGWSDDESSAENNFLPQSAAEVFRDLASTPQFEFAAPMTTMWKINIAQTASPRIYADLEI